MKHSSEKLMTDRNTHEVLKQFNAMPKKCLNESIQKLFGEVKYLMTKISGNAIIIAEIKGAYIIYNRFDF